MFSTFTTSRANGRPVELFLFQFGPSNLDRRFYVDAEFPVTYDGDEYSPVPIMRQEATNNGTLDKSTFDVTLPQSLDIPQMFRVYPPAHEISLIVLQGEAEDPDAEFVPVWHGRVMQCTFAGVEATLTCEPISTTFGRVALRRHYQYMCPHMLYGSKCKADKVPATSSVAAYSVAGRDLTLTTLIADPAGYLGGSVEWFTSTGLMEARTILAITEVAGRSVLRLSGLTRDLLAGDALSLILGCQHTEESCIALHNNVLNFGGMPWIPKQNPVGASSIY